MITTPCFSLTQQFVKFFEEKFEQFIKENGSTTKEFYSKVKASALEDPEGENSDFVQVSTSGWCEGFKYSGVMAPTNIAVITLQTILAVTDYEVFIAMMKDVAAEKARKA